MIRHELMCLEDNLQDIYKAIEYAYDYEIDTICIPASKTKNLYLNNTEKFSAIIGYPIGSLEANIKIHETNSCFSRGVSRIDFTINHDFLESFNLSKIVNELKAISKFCNTNKIFLRPVLEIKYLSSEEILKVVDIFIDFGISEMIAASGYIFDDYEDNLILSRVIQDKYSINVISSAPIICKSIYDQFDAFEIFGVRIKSYKTLHNLCIR